MRAFLGGTSGAGNEPPLSLLCEDLEASFGGLDEDKGITNGARFLGDSGCFGEDDLVGFGVLVRSSGSMVLSSMMAIISASSSNDGPDIIDSMFSPNGC